MSKITLACPQCKRRLRVPNALIGRWITCPNCSMQFAALSEELPSSDPPPSSEEPAPAEGSGQRPHPWMASGRLLAGVIALSSLVLLVVAVMILRVEPSNGKQSHQNPEDQGAADPTPTPSYEGWMQDLEGAKHLAAKENKDLLILFTGSDWHPESQELAFDVLTKPGFQELASRRFVRVLVDFPIRAAGKAKVKDSDRNKRLQQEFGLEARYPTLLVADPGGRPYAVITGFNYRLAAEYLDNLMNIQQVRMRRDQLLEEVRRAQGPAQLKAAREAVDFLDKKDIIQYYGTPLEEWARLGRTQDPKNLEGHAEFLFAQAWLVNLFWACESSGNLQPVLARLDEWMNEFRVFKDPDLGARCHYVAGTLLLEAKNLQLAKKYFQKGLECGPRNPKLSEQLRYYCSPSRSGTGFVVAPGGYVLTNYHVIKGPGRVMVRLPESKEPLPAKLIAQDNQRDIALLKVEVPGASRLVPLCLAGRPAQRGEQVLALGHPLGGALKITQGIISEAPESGNENLLVTDAKVNPGSSGGPLCDYAGNVVGMVSRKTNAGTWTESYGKAIPSNELAEFLRTHLNDYRSPVIHEKTVTPAEVDKLVSPAVLMVLKEDDDVPQ